VKVLISWLSAGAICSESSRELLPITKALRYQILRTVFRTPGIEKTEKELMLRLEMAQDFSDVDTV
jgi:hypothetical protein